MRSGADSEMTSGFEGPEVDVIKQAPGMRATGQTALASAELYVIIDLPKKAPPDKPANVPMRGIEPAGMTVRDELSIVEGRMFQFGTNEVIVGRGANGQFVGTERRRHDRVGHRTAGRWSASSKPTARVAETEIWCDARDAAGRLPARQHLSSRCWRGSIRRTRSPCSATG